MRYADPSGLKATVLQPQQGGHSAAFCVQIASGMAGYATLMGCLAKDDTGRRAFLVTGGTGGIAGAGTEFTTGFQVANGRIQDLLGPFGNIGGSLTAPAAPDQPITGTVGMDFSCSAGCSTVVVTIAGGPAINLNLGFPRADVHGTATNTWEVQAPDLIDSPSVVPVWGILDAILWVQGL
jgi:hypothetical protein